MINSNIIPCYAAHCASVRENSSGSCPSEVLADVTIVFSTITTHCAGIFSSISIARAPLLKSSATLKIRKLLPQISTSCIKSIDQLQLKTTGITSNASHDFLRGRREISISEWCGFQEYLQTHALIEIVLPNTERARLTSPGVNARVTPSYCGPIPERLDPKELNEMPL